MIGILKPLTSLSAAPQFIQSWGACGILSPCLREGGDHSQVRLVIACVKKMYTP